jgi:hypothetical protein
VADAGNKRIQVFDGEGTFKSQIGNVGTPQAICVSGGATQYLFSSNSNDPESMENGEIYKLSLSGQVAGKFGKAGKMPKEFGMVNSLDCRRNELIVGEVGTGARRGGVEAVAIFTPGAPLKGCATCQRKSARANAVSVVPDGISRCWRPSTM